MAVERVIWGELLSEAERAGLAPGVPDGLERRPDVLVVGGGLLGLATAVACQRAGLGSVVLIERERLGAGSTGGAAGLLLPEAHVGIEPPWFIDLARRSLGLWRDLDAAWPGGLGLLDLDWLGLDPQPPGAAGLPIAAHRLDARTVARLVPGLRQPVAGQLAQRQARVNPLRVASRLAAGLGCVATGVEARAVRLDGGGRVVAVTTSAGEFEPGVVVFATGGPPMLDGLDLAIPAGHVKGHLLVTEPSAVRLPGSVAPVATQLEDGRLLVGGSVDVGDESTSVRPEVVSGMWRDLQAQLASATDITISHQWCCFRPWHPDGLPVVDRVPGLTNAWLTSGQYKTGILMAPITARLLCDWIASGQQPPETHPMCASRFSS